MIKLLKQTKYRRINMATTDEIIIKTAPAKLVDHNLIDHELESVANGMVKYEKRPAKDSAPNRRRCRPC